MAATSYSKFGPRLPFDILISVINEVGRAEDVRTLRSCSLLNHDLLYYCQKYLFKTFDSRKAQNPEKQLVAFSSLLNKKPHLVRFLEVVHIRESTICYFGSEPWESVLSDFLRLLTNVTTFGLYVRLDVGWDGMCSALRNEIVRIISRPKFEDLRLTNVMNIPRLLLNCCRSLKHLNVTGLTLCSAVIDAIEDKTLAVSADLDSSHPETIKICDSEEFVLGFPPCPTNLPFAMGFSRLRRLTLTLTPAILNTAWKMINTAQETLEELALILVQEFHIHEHGGEHFEDFIFASGQTCLTFEEPYQSLSRLSRLVQLTISVVPIENEDHSPEEHLSEMYTLLDTSPPSLQVISIQLDLFSTDSYDIKMFLEHNVSKGLDAKLSDTALFPSLTCANIEVLLPDEFGYTTESEYSSDLENESDALLELFSSYNIKEAIIELMPLTIGRLGKMIAINVRVGHSLDS